MELAERKYTTQKGLEELQTLLEELQTLIDSLIFYSDVNSVESEMFYARIELNNGCAWNDIHRVEWTNKDAKWQINKGKINLISVNAGMGEEAVKIEEIDQLCFPKCLENLKLVIKKYNAECEKKDAQIENFLKFCANYKKIK